VCVCVSVCEVRVSIVYNINLFKFL